MAVASNDAAADGARSTPSPLRKPFVGLVGLGVGFLTQPLGHTAYALLESSTGDALYLTAFATGGVGLALSGTGHRKAELPETGRGPGEGDGVV